MRPTVTTDRTDWGRGETWSRGWFANLFTHTGHCRDEPGDVVGSVGQAAELLGHPGSVLEVLKSALKSREAGDQLVVADRDELGA